MRCTKPEQRSYSAEANRRDRTQHQERSESQVELRGHAREWGRAGLVRNTAEDEDRRGDEPDEKPQCEQIADTRPLATAGLRACSA